MDVEGLLQALINNFDRSHPVVFCSNTVINKNKLNGIYVLYIVTNTTIFFVVYLLLLRHNYAGPSGRAV